MSNTGTVPSASRIRESVEIAASNMLSSQSVLRVVFQLLRQSARTLTSISPEADSRVLWQEFGNKLHAFCLFEHLDSSFDLAPDGLRSLQELVDQARSLDSYEAVWVMEGLGHYYSKLQLTGGTNARELLTNHICSPLSSSSLVPLHAGMGLALAERVLSSIEQDPHRWLPAFEDTCRINSRDGYFGAAYEALGLAARNLYPHLILQIDRVLASISHELQAFFWHGVGRATYFSPTNLLPWRAAPWRGLRNSSREPPHRLGRRNAVAGFCWALTLVNIRHPEVMAMFLKHHANDVSDDNACANGIRSALIIWRNAASDQHLKALLQYKPADSIRAIWEELVLRSCEAAMKYQHELQSRKTLGEVFRFQPLTDLLPELRDGDRHVEISV